MKVLGIEHLGIAVKSLEYAIPYYESLLGVKCYAIEEVLDQKVKTAFFKVGDAKIELLETTDPEGPIGLFIEKKGQGIHHIAFKVDDVDKSLVEAKSQGIRLIDKKGRLGAEGLSIGFLNPKSTFGVLTELCSSKSQIE